jgi:hypothetical protein
MSCACFQRADLTTGQHPSRLIMLTFVGAVILHRGLLAVAHPARTLGMFDSSAVTWSTSTRSMARQDD